MGKEKFDWVHRWLDKANLTFVEMTTFKEKEESYERTGK